MALQSTSNFRPSVKSADLKLTLNFSEYVSLQTLLCLRSVTVWSWCTFQGLQHAVSGVGQKCGSLLQLRHSFGWCPPSSTCSAWRSLGFQKIQLFLQSQQVLNTSVGAHVNGSWLLTVFPDPVSIYKWKLAKAFLSPYCPPLLLSQQLLSYLELPGPSAVRSPADLWALPTGRSWALSLWWPRPDSSLQGSAGLWSKWKRRKPQKSTPWCKMQPWHPLLLLTSYLQQASF